MALVINCHEAMKTCSECKEQYANDRLVCLQCNKSLEDQSYLNWILWTLLLSVPLAIVLRLLGYRGAGMVLEVIIWEPALLAVLYPIAKVVQRIRDPSRPVLDEMKSVFGERANRIGLLIAIAFFGWFSWTMHGSHGEGRTPVSLMDPSWKDIVFWGRASVLLLLPVAGFLLVFDQGWRFFNLKIANTYAEQERRRVCSAN
jgi:hypothetical protein